MTSLAHSPRTWLPGPAHTLDRQTLALHLAPHGQEHLARFWDALSGAEKQQLGNQIDALDLALLAELREQGRQLLSSGVDSSAAQAQLFEALAARATAPPAMRLDGSGAIDRDQALAAGADLLTRGQVAMILVAGGLGSRLGFELPKGFYQLAPLSQRTLFDILISQLSSVERRYGQTIPLYIMTSPATDALTREFLEKNNYFGKPRTSVRIFCQNVMWALDEQWNRLLMSSPSSLFLGPDGHGGMLRALAESGCLADAEARGITQIFYGQIDNPLLQVCSELLLGSHVLAQSEMTTQVVEKRHPLERVGNVVEVDGKVQVIEYVDLPESAARATSADGRLKLWAGNLAVHVFDTAFLARANRDQTSLPFHFARKKVPTIDDSGAVVEPTSTNAIRFERFIFDLLPAARKSLVVEADPAEAFAPVKNAEHEKTDTAATARAAMIAQARRWLEAAGAHVAPQVRVEIHPAFAATIDELRARVKPGTVIDRDTYFSPSGAL